MRWPAALLGLLLMLAGIFPPAASDAAREDWTVRYHGHSIRMHVVKPAQPGPWPFAIILHGASGLGQGHMFWPLTEELADRGIASVVVRYYDGLSDRVKRKQSPHLFSQREQVLDHVIGDLTRRKIVKDNAIGVYGYSLGGFHAIALAAKDSRIAAAVSLAGGLSGHIPHTAVEGAAPLLLIHGTRDRVVPYRRSMIARSIWRQSAQPVELVALEGIGHVPYGESRQHAFQLAAAFLEEHLKDAVEAPVPRARPSVPIPRFPPPSREVATAP